MDTFEHVPKNEQQEYKSSESSPDLRIVLSDAFMEYLDKNKEPSEQTIRMREIIGVPEDYSESEEGLRIFRDSLYDLIKDPRFPEGKEKMALRVHLENLNTFSLRDMMQKAHGGNLSSQEISQLENPLSNPINGLGSYTHSIEAILSVLKNILTPEINLAIRAYSERIFAEPLKHTAEKKGFGF